MSILGNILGFIFQPMSQAAPPFLARASLPYLRVPYLSVLSIRHRESLRLYTRYPTHGLSFPYRRTNIEACRRMRVYFSA